MLDTFFSYGFEKLWRLQNYVDDIKDVSGYPKEVLIVKKLSEDIESIRAQILELAKNYQLHYKNPSVDDSVKLLGRFSSIFKEFQHLLNLLRYTYTPWPSEQLYELLRELNAPETQSIVLTDPYEYWIERDKYPPLYALPKTEKDNPLMWPILGHEIGHTIWFKEDIGSYLDEDERFDKLVDRFYDHEVTRKLSSSQIMIADILKRWNNEYFADLYAINFIGPCYLPSLLNFSFTLDPSRNIWVASDTHPPIAHRIESIIKYLENRLETMFKSNDKVVITEAKFIKKYLKTCKQFFSIRSKIHEENRYILDVNSQRNDFSFEPKSKEILESIKDIAFESVLNVQPLEDGNNSFYLSPFSNSCLKRMADVIPIGSIPEARDTDDIEKTFAKIEATYLNVENSEVREQDQIRKDLYRQLQNAVHDVPVSVKTIINVGWFYHIKGNQGKAFQWNQFINDASQGSVSWEKALDMYHSWLRQQDELISASIDQSKVHATLIARNRY